MSLSFKEYLLTENATADVAKLQADIATLDAAIQQKTAPLVQQRMRLQKMLVVKQKQKQAEDAKVKQQAGQSGSTQQQPAGTPGMVAQSNQGPNTQGV
jgi:hypothetical protein